MDHFPMLCRMLKYASFLGPFPWHSNRYAPTNDESVHQAMHLQDHAQSLHKLEITDYRSVHQAMHKHKHTTP